MLIAEGWLKHARHCPSPNFGPRPEGATVRLVVVHNISLPPGEFGGPHIDELFTNQLNPSAHPYFKEIEGRQVSSHLLIRRTGEIVQYVSLDDRAWHAGLSSYLGVKDCNDYSIGIELEGTDELPFTDAQYNALSETLALVHAAYPETQNHLAGHSDIAPGRKTDPGAHFDWARVRSRVKELQST